MCTFSLGLEKKVWDSEGLAKGIEALIEDGRLRRKLTENGYEFVQNFFWEKMANGVLKVVNDLVNR